MVPDESRYERDRYAECHRGEEILPYIDPHLTDIGEPDRWCIWGELDDEDSEDEIGLYEMIEFLDE